LSDFAIIVERKWSPLTDSNCHIIASWNVDWGAAKTLFYPLAQPCPTQMAYWAKNYVTVL